MRFYNTLAGKKEEFVPLEQGKVKMYSCGPTVYNYFHIGNARPFIIFDTLRTYLEYRGYEVTFVQNFTDVDDKIINRANEEGITPLEVADKYIGEYFKDADKLGIRRASVHPRVTECIEDIIEFIRELIDKGHAYEVDGDVYYDTKSFEDYGKLSKQNMEELEAGARIGVDERKNNPTDFALWKKKKEGEIGWNSPWGEGRPGWHIECSVMSRKYLGDTIDIHSGGQDLTFPHHENEIAQSEGRSGEVFANYWLHNGYINIDNQKMSKSLNNFFTVREIIEKVDPEAVRFFLLSAHYRNPVNFSQELLDASKNGLNRLYNAKNKLSFLLEQAEGAMTEDEKNQKTEVEAFRHQFVEAMDDDLNTADGITAVFELAKYINTHANEGSSKEFLTLMKDVFEELAGVLNIVQKERAADVDEAKILELIEQRNAAKKEKNYQEADRIREELKEMGIELLDTRQGTTWKKID
ncbi:MAG: cysteine--tRNA ligase [Filifactor alocis]|nr:cysteine--tRNA ligase [Filifactor alocis]